MFCLDRIWYARGFSGHDRYRLLCRPVPKTVGPYW